MGIKLDDKCNGRLGNSEIDGYENGKCVKTDDCWSLMRLCENCGLSPCIESDKYVSEYECCYCGREGVIIEEGLD